MRWPSFQRLNLGWTRKGLSFNLHKLTKYKKGTSLGWLGSSGPAQTYTFERKLIP